MGGGNGAGERIGLEQFLAQQLDQPAGAAPALAKRCSFGLDLVAKRGDVGPRFAPSGLRTAFAGSDDDLFQQPDLLVAIGQRGTRGGQVAIAEDRAVLGLCQFGSAVKRVVEVGIEHGDDGGEFGSRPRPAEDFSMEGCHGRSVLVDGVRAGRGLSPPSRGRLVTAPRQTPA
ncbi:hypothetical protein [Mesorhizobium sp. M7A.F.Ca.MR.148.00.0.0]|uniref:hypothetical protein n=1 Tax=Mesorhizobium sp. M7A.F.Ca.MR.148.00.0.0 TaxID=2496775 RepID=UPI0013E3BBBF|nr:hypothetical protein [Mesorhizobium sp. M7A.F.Ca.MR.148.00.0.0]